MTREEAIKELQESHDMMRSYNIDESESRLMTALDMAIQALQAQADGEYVRKKDVMGCIGQTSLHFELARKLKKLPTVAIPSAEPKWILTSERLPNVGQWVLVTTKDYQKYVEVMCYQGIRIGEHNIGNGWEEYEYPSWTSGHGDILGSHPEAWMPLPKPYESQEISARNLKMWEEIYAEEKRRERSEE